MSHIERMIAELCPDGVEHRPLGEIGTFTRGAGIQKSDLVSSGVPTIHYGELHTYYGIWARETRSFVNDKSLRNPRYAEPGSLIIVTTSEDDEAVGKATAWLGLEPTVVSTDALIFEHSQDPKFVSYFFNSNSFQQQKRRFITGTKVRRISGRALEKLIIPVPPMEVQREIVRILDNFSQLEAELEAELEARRKQYEFYRDQLLTFREATHTHTHTHTHEPGG